MIDFASLKVGDRAAMPSRGWDAQNQAIYRAAGEYAKAVEDDPKPQFEVANDPDGSCWLTRIR